MQRAKSQKRESFGRDFLFNKAGNSLDLVAELG
jgi:hypothetical protein